MGVPSRGQALRKCVLPALMVLRQEVTGNEDFRSFHLGSQKNLGSLKKETDALCPIYIS